jgi:DNA-binding PadR family transcriptional regulator
MKNDEALGFLPLTPATFHILATVAAGPMHGYAIKREVEHRTNGVVRLGASTLYAGIQRMEREGLLEEVSPPEESRQDVGSRWRFYEITDLGREVLDMEVARLESDLELVRARIPGTHARQTS